MSVHAVRKPNISDVSPHHIYPRYSLPKYRSPAVSLGIFSEVTDGTMRPGVDSASKNEYQENSWE
jgi:hypothetical protein